MLAHLRTDAYPVYGRHVYPPALVDRRGKELSYEGNNTLIDEAKRSIEGGRTV